MFFSILQSRTSPQEHSGFSTFHTLFGHLLRGFHTQQLRFRFSAQESGIKAQGWAKKKKCEKRDEKMRSFAPGPLKYPFNALNLQASPHWIEVTGHNVVLKDGHWSVTEAIGQCLAFKPDAPGGSKKAPKKERLGSFLELSAQSHSPHLTVGWVLRGVSTLRPLNFSPLRPAVALGSSEASKTCLRLIWALSLEGSMAESCLRCRNKP